VTIRPPGQGRWAQAWAWDHDQARGNCRRTRAGLPPAVWDLCDGDEPHCQRRPRETAA